MPETPRTVTQTAIEARRVQVLSTIIANRLSTAAAKTTLDLQGLIATMRASGMTNIAIKEALLADLTTGGIIFGTYRNSIKSTVKAGIRKAGNLAAMNRFEKAGVKEYVWVAVSSNPCPDCDSRAGERGTKEYFDNIGMPGSGFSVCQAHCHCQVVLGGYKGDSSLTRA